LVAACPSGLVTVIERAPRAASLATVRFRVSFVGLTYVTPFTVTPPPLTVAAIRFGKPVPGSKKPLPELETAVTVTASVAARNTVDGEALDGAVGGGAPIRRMTTPHLFVESAL